MNAIQQTEVVKIRLGSEDKVRLQEIAKNKFRSFADQCRLALHEWLETKSARPGRGAAADTKEAAQQQPTAAAQNTADTVE